MKKICENCTRSKHRTLEEKKALIEYDNTLTINDLNKFVEKAGFKSLGIYDEKKKNKIENKKRIRHFYFFSNSCFIYFHGSYVEISSSKYFKYKYASHKHSLVPRRKNLPASENLIRLLTKREDLISINKAVDIYNILSIELKLCLGAHTIDKVDGNVTLKTSYI